jgi:MFS family permease
LRGSSIETEPESHDAYAAFRIADYRRYLSGWFAALIGTQIQGVAIGWEMYQRTGEALALGLVGLAQAAPTMVLALPAGYIADRFSRRKVVILSLVGMTITSICLAFLSYSEGSIAWMYALLVMDATFATIGRPARSAFLPQLVPREIYPNAVAWSTSMMQLGWVVGPAVGGVIIVWSVPSAYVAAAAGSTIYALLLLSMSFRATGSAKAEAPMAALFGGLTFLKGNRLVLTLMSLDMFAVLLGGAVYLLPIYAEEILHVGPEGFGWLRAAPAMGAFCMALLIAHLPPMQKAGWNLLMAVGAFGVVTIVFGISNSFWPSFAMLFLTGLFDNVSMVIRHTLIQLSTPDAMRGRVSAVSGVFVSASNELGGLESGVVAHYFGPVFSVVSGGIGTIFVVLATGVLSPRLRRQGALTKT